ncbi:MAG: LLM class flavin-dependent oxidoreductase [Dehalococcoidia bacterium]
MAAKRIGVRTGMGKTAAETTATLEKLRVAEDVGVESVWTAEAWGLDAFTFLTAAALHTRRLGLATAIVNVFSRSAATLAMTAAAIDQLSGGRMILGLGSSGDQVVEHWHGVPFDRPLGRLREYVEIINMILAGQPLHYDGRIFHLQRGFTLRDQAPVRSHIPIFVAAITPASIRQTGAIADGIIPIYWPKEQLPALRAELDEGSVAAGRPAGAVAIAHQVNLYVVPDGADEDERAAVWRQAQAPVAYYIGRMGTFYAAMLRRHGYEAEVEASLAAWARRDAAGAAAAVSDRLLLATTLVGRVEECAEQMAERAALGADLQLISLPPGSPSECGRTLERLLR